MPTVDKFQVLRELCKKSLKQFVIKFWPVIIPDEPLVWNWHMDILCHELQKVAERVMAGLPNEGNLIFNVPPGTTKSTICSVMFPCWVMTRMPNARFICGSFSQDLALELSRYSRDIVKSEKYQSCFPYIKMRADQDAKGFWVNTCGGFRFSVGTGGSAVGRHAHFIIVDDPINPNAALSKADLESTNIWMDEHLSQRKVDKEITATILIMQRLAQSDPTGNWLTKGIKVKHFCMPAELTGNVTPKYLAGFYKDGLLDPRRLGPEALKTAKKVLGDFGYAGQYLQSPVPRGGGMFKIDRIKWGHIPKRLIKAVRYWDKAATLAGGAFTVGFKMGKADEDQFWGLDCVRGQWEAAERERTILNTAKSDGRLIRIGIEWEPGGSGKESAQASVRRLAGFRVFKDRVAKDKTLRADEFSIIVNNGDFWLPGTPALMVPVPFLGISVPQDAPHWVYDWLEEMMFWPHGKFLDQGDASSGAFNMLAGARKRVGAVRVMSAG